MATPVAAPVYSSVADLEQYPSPQTASRYAVIPGLGMFRWNGLSIASRNGTTVLGTANIGRWLLSDTFGNGSVWKQACFVAATTNLDLSGAETIDGQSVTTQTVLCTAQTDTTQNGPWTASSSGAWSRPSWFSSSADVQPGAMFPVIAGTTYGGSLWMLTSPTSGTITPGTTALSFDQVGGNVLQLETFTPLLDFSGSGYQIATSHLSRVFLGVSATDTHLPGATKIVFIPANTVASSASLVVASDFNTTFWEPFVPTNDYRVTITALPNGQFFSSGSDLGLVDSTLPTISSASVNVGSNPDGLTVVFADPMYLPDLTGISLSFSAGTARTITAIESASTDALTWGLTLSGNFSGSEVCSLVVGASRTWQDLNKNKIAAGSTSVSVTGTWSTSNLSNLALWIDPGQGHATADGGQVSSVTNVGSAGGTFTQSGTARPTYNANGFGTGLPWFDYDGTDDCLESTLTLGNIVTDGGEWYIGAVVAVDSIDTDAASDTNDAILSESGGYFSFMFRSSNGANVYIFDGGTKLVAASIGTPPVTKVLIEARATTGTCYLRINKGTEQTVAAGDVGLLLGALKIGANRTKTVFANFKHGELWMTAGDPGVTQRNNQADYSIAKYTIP